MDLAKINLNHIAIIMDGNGRWAQDRGLERTAGHAAGEESLSKTIHWALQNNLRWLTVYAFSTENWMRSSDEVEFLMFFNRDLLIRRREEFNNLGVRFHFLGNLDDEKIPVENKVLMSETEEQTSSNIKLNLVFAFNYGSRDEVHKSIEKFTNDHDSNVNIELVSDKFREYMYIPSMPDPDLLIRTAGEQRLSNFLLYQLSYTELMFFKTLWPEFCEVELNQAVEEFSKRKRTYGKA
ncbi:polyprenyl diphosphate synthase [Acidimicrobiia bacterium]|nr:polyprenyl diphosphate synthase [Candidatus Actinomarina sp.]MDC3374219.1 polyprenyl diphosphate synthase [Acidimicrobiia bacterium]